MPSHPDDENALLRAVLAHPDDDRPRLDYAAWLDRHGQPSRAELIRVQCDVEKLQARERELLDEHATDWSRPLARLGVTRATYRRGFPEELEVRWFPHLLDNHREIAALTPIRSLWLWQADDQQVAQLAGLDTLRHLRSLEVGGPSLPPSLPNSFGAAGVYALANSPHLAGLRALTLHSDDIGARGANHIMASPYLRDLQDLWLDDPVFNRRRSQNHTEIALTPSLAKLDRLRLGNKLDLGEGALYWMRRAAEPRDRQR